MGIHANPAHAVYAEQLMALGHGMPLWDPEPSTVLGDGGEFEDMGEVMIGDVGWMVDGSFRRLFNVTLPADHKFNKDNCPSEFKNLEFNRRLLSSKDKYLQPGPICSKSVRAIDIEVGGDAGLDPIAGAGAAYRFQCHNNQGAMLFLKDSAKKEHAVPNRTFQTFMKQNHETWYNYAKELGVDCSPDDIILVRGWTKTTEWAVTSWCENGQSHEVSVNAQGSSFAQVNIKVAGMSMTASLPEIRTGPNRKEAASTSSEETKCDQCIFLHYYKIKHRKWLGKKIVGGAGPHSLPPSPNPGEFEPGIVTTGPSGQNTAEYDNMLLSPGPPGPHTRYETEIEGGTLTRGFHDPLDDALDYILKHSAAEVAIMSDGDISELLGNRQWPEDMAGYLRETMPKIDVDEDGTGTLSLEEGIVRNHAAEVEAAEHALNIQNINQQLQDVQVTGGPEEPGGMIVDPPNPDVGTADPLPEGPLGEGGNAALLSNNPRGDEPKEIPERLRGGTVVLRKHLQGGTAIDWPQHVLYDSTSEGGAVCSVSVSKDGRRIAGGFEDAIVRVWDLRSGVIVHRLEGHEETVWATQFAPTENKLASASADATAAIWDMATGQKIQTLEGHDGSVWSLAYSPDGKEIATGSTDGTAKLWNVETGELLATFGGHSSSVLYMSFSPDGSRLTTGAGSVGRIWNTKTFRSVASLEGHTNIIWALAFSSDGSRIVTGAEDATGRIWSADTGDELVTLREHAGPIWAASFSPDGKTVALGSYDATATICNSYTGERYFLLRERPSVVNSLAYSSDGEYLTTGSVDGAVKVWETATGSFVAELQGHTDKVKSLRFTPDGGSIVSSSDDGTIRVWSLTDILRL